MPTRKPINLRKPPTLKKGPLRSSKRVLDRLKATESLRAAIETHKARAADGFRRKLAAELRDGETVPDQTLALELAVRSVETAIDFLVRADHAYTARATRRRLLNEAVIDVARREVYPELVDVRRAIDARFGRETGAMLHRIAGPTCRKPKRLYPQLLRVVIALKHRRHLPTPVRPGPPGERRHWLSQLEPGQLKLKAMLRDLQEQEIVEQKLRNDRDYELESFDVTYGEALAFVRSVFQLGGRDRKVIWHLLPTVRRRRLKAKARQESEARAEGRRAARGESANKDENLDDSPRMPPAKPRLSAPEP